MQDRFTSPITARTLLVAVIAAVVVALTAMSADDAPPPVIGADAPAGLIAPVRDAR